MSKKKPVKQRTVISYTNARNSLAKRMEQVCLDRSPLVITRKDAEACVLISISDYQAMEESAYLLRSPKNAQRLMESVEQINSGKVKSRKVAA